MGNDSEWYFTGAKLFPNVKGCGYPPMLNCSIFYRQYANIGQNFSCYYSKVDPGIVISDLDMWQVSTIVYSFVLCVFRVCRVRLDRRLLYPYDVCKDKSKIWDLLTLFVRKSDLATFVHVHVEN